MEERKDPADGLRGWGGVYGSRERERDEKNTEHDSEARSPVPLSCYKMGHGGRVYTGPGCTRAPTHPQSKIGFRLHHRGLAIAPQTLESTVAPVYSSPRSINLSPTQEQPEQEAAAR